MDLRFRGGLVEAKMAQLRGRCYVAGDIALGYLQYLFGSEKIRRHPRFPFSGALVKGLLVVLGKQKQQTFYCSNFFGFLTNALITFGPGGMGMMNIPRVFLTWLIKRRFRFLISFFHV